MATPLLILHGSRGAASALRPLVDALRPAGQIEALNLLGHGGRAIPEQFSVEAFAADVLQQMDERGLERARLFGYSFGGYVALWLARHYPQRLAGVCTLATKVRYDAETVSHFTHLSSLERITAPGSPQPAIQASLHPGQDWRALATRLADLYRRLGEQPALSDEDFRAIRVPTLLMSAHADQLLPWQELLDLHRLIPASHAFTFAGRAHPIDALPLPLLSGVLATWLADTGRA
jgi:pimeloyl-ACP methyl ester carboxylesterase